MDGTVTNSMLAIMKFDTPVCTKCGQLDKKTYSELFEKQETICGFCGNSISLINKEWSKTFEDLVQDIRAQYGGLQ